MIFDSYFSYYESPTDKNLLELIEVILSGYDFSDFYEAIPEIAKIRPIVEPDESSMFISTGGSTGLPRRFYLGSHAQMCLDSLERKLRMREFPTVLVYNSSFGTTKSSQSFSVLDVDSRQRDFDVVGEWTFPSHISKLVDFLNFLYDKSGPFNILSLPFIWICLSTCPIFKEWVFENKHKINSFLNTDCGLAIKDLGVYVRDQMIDWGTGVNFYTCRFGSKHFIPIFHWSQGFSSNLLNLNSTNPVQSDDDVGLGAARLCGCGEFFIPIDIKAHVKNIPLDHGGCPIDFRPVYNGIEGWFHSLQIHQDPSGLVRVLFDAQGSVDDDISRIRDFLHEKGLENISFERSIYLQNGSKRHPFWRSEQFAPRRFASPSRGCGKFY